MCQLLRVAWVLASATLLQADQTTITSTNNTEITSPASVGADKEHANKDLKFVNQIRDNLRKNNDDYADQEQELLDTRRRYRFRKPGLNNVSPRSSTTPPPSTTTTRINIADSINKNHNANDKNSRTLFVRKVKPNKVASMTKPMATDSDLRKERVDKWKQLIEKNKRLHAYTSTTRITPTPSVVTTTRTFRSVAMRMQQATAGQRASSYRNPFKIKHFQRPPRPILNRILPMRNTADDRTPPHAEQLDMAPARGAFMHDMRQKHRFCHRHVLWPEGPKYDSKGKTILPAFDANIYNGNRSFVDTTKPLFLLPRCCNCCKKSVLGCQ